MFLGSKNLGEGLLSIVRDNCKFMEFNQPNVAVKFSTPNSAARLLVYIQSLFYFAQQFYRLWFRFVTNYRLISCPEGPEIFSGGLPYPTSFQPIQIPRRHPPPLAQRERSTSAPNVCYNMVGNQSGVDSTLEDWTYRIKMQNMAATGKLPFHPFCCCCMKSIRRWLCKMKWLSNTMSKNP